MTPLTVLPAHVAPAERPSREPVTEADVRAAVLDNDPAAWERLIERLSRQIVHVTVRNCGVPAIVADNLVHDGWCKAWLRRDQFGRDGDFHPHRFLNWLICIVAHEWIDRQRRRSHRNAALCYSELSEAQQWSYETIADHTAPLPLDDLTATETAEQNRRLVARAFAGASASDRGVMPHLLYAGVNVDGRHDGRSDVIGAAEALGISRLAAKSRLDRCRRRARERVTASLGLPATATLDDVLARVEQEGVA